MGVWLMYNQPCTVREACEEGQQDAAVEYKDLSGYGP